MARVLSPFLVLLIGCNPDNSVKAFNAEPEAEITSHEDDVELYEGSVETFRGSVSDPDHDADDLVAIWYLGADVVCEAAPPGADGTTSCDVLITSDATAVSLEVRDPQDAAGSDIVAINAIPSDSPEATILSPEGDGVYYSDQLVTFSGLVSDGEDSPEVLIAQWESSQDGVLDVDATPNAAGEVSGYGNLTEGQHAIELHVEDTTGKTRSASVIIDVGPPNSAPTCDITAPTDGHATAQGSEVLFEGLVDDVDVPEDWLSVTWDSDVDGRLRESVPSSDGSVGFAFDALSVATHRVTMTVTDELGQTCTDAIYVTVGTPPSLLVSAPLSGAIENEDEDVTFEATVSDSEDPPTDLTLSWSSDIDGEFSTQGADSTGSIRFSIDSLTTGDHALTVRVTDADGLYTEAWLDLTINATPTAPTVSISPDPAQTDSNLTASATGAVDPDGSGSVVYSYAWYEDGTLSSASTTSVFPAASTTKDRTYMVVVTPSDGTGDGETGEAEITITNTAPVLTGPTLDASTAGVGDTLTCSASATDSDTGDVLTISYAWNDGSTGSTYTIDADDDPGDTLTCTATVDDGDGGTDTGTTTATVDNTNPVVATVSISPGSGAVGDTLTCSATAADADGGSPSISYAWNDGSTGSTYTIDAADDPGDTLTCTATATDADGGTGSGTATATVDNTVPVMGTVSVSPSSGAVGDTLTCSASATDADGGIPSISYAWQDGSTGSTYTIDASDDPGDTLTCTATATDADGGTGSGTATATVDNTAPVMGTVGVSPSSGSVGDTLTCSATATDADGGIPSISYAWNDGSTASTYTIDADDDPGDTLTCTATADDTDGGSDVGTATAMVTNSAPTISTIGVSPDSGSVGDTLTCSATAADADGDIPSISYAWNDGSTGSTYTIDASDDPGDTLTCTATATDADGGTGSGTATATVDNTVPVMGTVSVSPGSGAVGDTLTCSASATDADGGSPSISYAWQDGSTGSTYTIDADDDPGDTVTCTATADDADGGSDVGTATATVDNTAPVMGTVSVSPSSGSVGDTLTCSATATDADGGSPSISYAWNDGSTGSTYTIDAEDDPGDTVTCTAAADDTDGGSDVGTATAMVTNSAPVVGVVSISPGSASNDETLTCSASATDADGETPDITYQWSNTTTGASLGSGESVALSEGSASSEDTISCTATATDADGGVGTGVASLTLDNRAPVLSVTLTPDPAGHEDTLSCTATPSDEDGDVLSTTFSWTVAGVSVSATSTSGLTSTLAGAFFGGDEVSCQVQTDDGKTGGTASGSASVTITNLAPTISDLTLGPDPVYTNDILKVSVTIEDEDSESLTTTYDWYVAGSLVQSGEDDTLDGAVWFDRGDAVHVVVSVDDGIAETSETSGTVTILNSAPTAPVVSIEPEAPTDGYALTCTVTSESSDDDGDAISYTMDWTVDGTTYASGEVWTGPTTTTWTGDTVSNGDTLADEVWSCTATPSDGSATGSTATDSVTVTKREPVTVELADADYMFLGENNYEYAGQRLANAGDVDGDGLDDVLISAPGTTYGHSSAGIVCLFFASSLGSTSTLDMSEGDYCFIGEYTYDYAGQSVASAGDVDGDGYADILIGVTANDDGGTSAGKVYLILGGSLGSSSTIDLSEADYTFVGEGASDILGRSVASAGDVDGDGLDDIIFGAPYYNDDGNSGKVYLILGASLGSTSEIDLLDADYSFTGDNTGTSVAGFSVSGAGDVDDDGYDDILIGAYGNDEGGSGSDAGKSYLFYGSSLGSVSELDLADADHVFIGESSTGASGYSVAGAGDVDGDGFDDILIGAPWSDDVESDAGTAYLILGGNLDASGSTDLVDADVIFYSEISKEWAGYSVASAGDADGDGLADVLIGAPYDNDSSGSGNGYLFLGRGLSSGSTEALVDADYIFVGEDNSDFAGGAICSAGDINDDGYDDVLIGAPQNFDVGTLSGKAYLVLLGD